MLDGFYCSVLKFTYFSFAFSNLLNSPHDLKKYGNFYFQMFLLVCFYISCFFRLIFMLFWRSLSLFIIALLKPCLNPVISISTISIDWAFFWLCIIVSCSFMSHHFLFNNRHCEYIFESLDFVVYLKNCWILFCQEVKWPVSSILSMLVFNFC